MTQPPILPPRGPAASDAATATSATPASAPGASGAAKSSSDVKPLEGKTTIDDKLNIECEILCYRALSKIAAQIAQEFRTKVNQAGNPTCIIFLDETIKAALQIQQAFVLQGDLLQRSFQRFLPAQAPAAPVQYVVQLAAPAAAAGLAAATTLGRSVIDLLALFRTDVSYSGRSVNIKEAPLVLELAEKLRTDNSTFLYPRLLLYQPAAPIQVSAQRLENSLQGLLDARDAAEDAVRQFAAQVAEEESNLADLMAQAAEKHKHADQALHDQIKQLKEELIPKRLQLADQRARFTALDTQLKALLDSLGAPDPKSGVPPLQLIQQAEELLARFADENKQTYFLWAEVSSAGGSYQIRRNLWRTLFWSDGLRYSGGAIVTYAFFDGSANVVLSGTHRYREPFTRFPDSWGAKTEGNSF